MIEYGPIQEFPRGLLDLLGLKIAGKNPDVMSNLVQPQLELLDWYLESRATNINVPILQPGATGSVGFFGGSPTTLVVPQNEFWRVHHFALSWSSATGNVIRSSPAAIFSTPSMQMVFGPPSQAFSAAIAVAPFVSAERVPFWLPPGSELGQYVTEATIAVPANGIMRVRYTPLRI